MAFYRNIAPYVKASDPSGHMVVQMFFEIDMDPESFNYYAYCQAKQVMENFLGSLSSDMGTLEYTDAFTCAATLPTGRGLHSSTFRLNLSRF
jgi:hypothetical protein